MTINPEQTNKKVTPYIISVIVLVFAILLLVGMFILNATNDINQNSLVKNVDTSSVQNNTDTIEIVSENSNSDKSNNDQTSKSKISNESKDMLVVKAKGGLSVRNKDCAIIDAIEYKTVMKEIPQENQESIECNLDDQIYEMIYVEYDQTKKNGYIAKEFATTVENKNLDINQMQGPINYKVNAVNGLNLRDIDCGYIKTVPDQTILDLPPVDNNSFLICELGNKFYNMKYVLHEDKAYWTPAVFLEISN